MGIYEDSALGHSRTEHETHTMGAKVADRVGAIGRGTYLGTYGVLGYIAPYPNLVFRG